MANQMEYFDKRAQEWWPPKKDLKFLFKANPLRFEYFDGFIGDWNGKRVLDVGCGGGYTCEYLARRSASVTGTDLSTGSLEAARNHARESGLEIDYLVCDEKSLPFPDASFDVVTCFDVLEHIEDKKATLGEIHRVLKPDGLYFFDTLNQSFWSRLIIIWLGEMVFRSEGGAHVWDLMIKPEDLASVLEQTRFTDARLAGVEFRFPPGSSKGLPLRIEPEGHKSIIYFGSARK